MRSSHYAMGWLSKFGRSDRAHCHFAAGFVEAAARHLFGGDFTARETSCVAKGDAHCVIEVARGGAPLSSSPGAGSLATFGARPAAATRTPVNEAAIIEACSGLPLAGDREGLVHAFGVSLTRHHANYYNLLCYRFERELESSAGPAAMEAARLLFIEAGRVCAFHTFGGIMLSAEWDALIKPQCQTREDWVYGMVSVVNALGWGRWSVAAIEPGARLELVVDGSYESNGYLAMYGASTAPRCYLATGGAAGLMNLIYNADIIARPELTPEFYEQTFRNPGFFVGRGDRVPHDGRAGLPLRRRAAVAVTRRDRVRGRKLELGGGLSAEIRRSCRNELRLVYQGRAFTLELWEQLSQLGRAEVLRASAIHPAMKDLFRVHASGFIAEGAVEGTHLTATFRGAGRLGARRALEQVLGRVRGK